MSKPLPCSAILTYKHDVNYNSHNAYKEKDTVTLKAWQRTLGGVVYKQTFLTFLTKNMIPNQLYITAQLQKNNSSNESIFNVLIFRRFSKKLQRNNRSATTVPVCPLGIAHACDAAAAECVRCSHVETVEYTSVLSKQNVSS